MPAGGQQRQGLPDASSFEFVAEHVHPGLLVGKDQDITLVNESCNMAHEPLLLGDVPGHHLNHLSTQYQSYMGL